MIDFLVVSAAWSVVATVRGHVRHVVVLGGRRRQRLGRRVRVPETVVRARRARCRPGVHGRRRLVGRLPRPQLLVHVAVVLSLVVVMLLLLEVLVDVDHVGGEVGQSEVRVGRGLLQNSLGRRGIRHEALVRFQGLEAGFARRVVAT